MGIDTALQWLIRFLLLALLSAMVMTGLMAVIEFGGVLYQGAGAMSRVLASREGALATYANMPLLSPNVTTGAPGAGRLLYSIGLASVSFFLLRVGVIRFMRWLYALL